MAHVSRPSARAEVASDLRVVFNAADEEEARRRLKLATERWRPEMPRLADRPWHVEECTDEMLLSPPPKTEAPGRHANRR